MKRHAIYMDANRGTGKDNSYSYIHLKKDIKDLQEGESCRQIVIDGSPLKEMEELGMEVIMDFDKSNKLVGIEIISRGDILPEEFHK